MRWFLKNTRRRALFALQHPRYTAGSILRELTLSDEKFISQITGISPRQIRSFINEPLMTPEFADPITAAAKAFHKLRIESADLFAKKVLMQYAAVRALRPERVVETGVANGVSSAYVLLGLNRNGKGQLYSIGLNDLAFLPPGKELGWLIPSWLRDRWMLHIGDAREVLSLLASRLAPLDIFIHDSLHTYEHMTWEFATAYPTLRHGGLLISDDALWNSAFHDFAFKAGELDARILRGVGFLRKGRF